jgi:hypothetical protein
LWQAVKLNVILAKRNSNFFKFLYLGIELDNQLFIVQTGGEFF